VSALSAIADNAKKPNMEFRFHNNNNDQRSNIVCNAVPITDARTHTPQKTLATPNGPQRVRGGQVELSVCFCGIAFMRPQTRKRNPAHTGVTQGDQR